MDACVETARCMKSKAMPRDFDCHFVIFTEGVNGTRILQMKLILLIFPF